jgi:hypothetical protein
MQLIQHVQHHFRSLLTREAASQLIEAMCDTKHSGDLTTVVFYHPKERRKEVEAIAFFVIQIFLNG